MADSTKHFNPVVTSGLFKPQKHTRKTNKKTHTHSHVIKMFYSLLGRQIGRHLSTSSSSPTNDGQSLTSGNCEGVLPLRHFLGSSHFPLRILPLYSSSKCSFGTDLFIIPFLVWNLTVQILPSFPGKVSTIFPSFHFPVAMFANVYMQDTFSKLALPHVILV